MNKAVKIPVANDSSTQCRIIESSLRDLALSNTSEADDGATALCLRADEELDFLIAGRVEQVDEARMAPG